jgi:hypothetical protein
MMKEFLIAIFTAWMIIVCFTLDDLSSRLKQLEQKQQQEELTCRTITLA